MIGIINPLNTRTQHTTHDALNLIKYLIYKRVVCPI